MNTVRAAQVRAMPPADENAQCGVYFLGEVAA